MNVKKTVLPVVVLALALFRAPILVGEDAPPAEGGGGKRVASSLGLHLDKPFESLHVGDKTNGFVENPTKLGSHGPAARKNERVTLTITGRGTFTIDVAGKSYKYKYSADGTVTPQL